MRRAMPTKKEMQDTIDCLSSRVTWLETQHARGVTKYKALDVEVRGLCSTSERHAKRIAKIQSRDDCE